MSAVAAQPWSVQRFFAWQEQQEDRYELVDGFPQLRPGASNRHEAVVLNILIELRDRLRGNPCRVFTAGSSLQTTPGQIRRPDVGVDCGPRNLDDYKASAPTVVFEVMSPSTRAFDQLRKNEEYRNVPTLRHIVYVEPGTVMALFWSRDEAGPWSMQSLKRLDDEVRLDAIGIALPMREIYDGLDLGPE